MSLRTQAVCAIISEDPRAAASARLQRARLRDPAVERCDRDAFQRMVTPLRPKLQLSALRLAKDRARAEDLVQETLLRAWRFWPRYVERDNCRAWLQRILLNVFRSEHRRSLRARAHWPQLEAAALAACDASSEASEAQLARCESLHRPEPPETATERRTTPGSYGHGSLAPEQAQLSEPLQRGLARLSDPQRRVLWLVDARERSYREAAAELACPVGTVMSRLHRARAALRAQLTREAARA